MNSRFGKAPLSSAHKIALPRLRQGWIRHPVCDAALAEGLRTRRATVLCAPAGFGKTTALVSCLHDQAPDTALAWVSCDQEDTLITLAAAIVAALEPFDLPWRVSVDALLGRLQDTPASRSALCAALIEALAGSECRRGLIVLDDLHHVRDAAAFDWLDGVLARLPAAWGLVVASRETPPLALARWRALGDLCEIGHEQLRFSPAEVARLLASHGEAANAMATRVCESTGGWPAGVRLMVDNGLRLPGRRFAIDYLADEVLDPIDGPLRRFLIDCSVLPEWTVSRCQQVSQDPRAAHWLAEVERRGLFATVRDGDEPSLQLHDLFRDALLDRLNNEEPEHVRTLWRRAAASEPDVLRRVGHLLRAQGWLEAVAMLEQAGTSLLASGALARVQQCIDRFPLAIRQSESGLQILLGCIAWIQRDWHGMLDAMQRAAELAAGTGKHESLDRARSYVAVALLGQGRLAAAAAQIDQLEAGALSQENRSRVLMAGCWHAVMVGDLARVAPLQQALLDLLVHTTRTESWFEFQPLPSFIGLPGVRRALQTFVQLALLAGTDAPNVPRCGVLVLQGWLSLAAGEIALAEAALRHAQSDARWLGLPPHTALQLKLLEAYLAAMRTAAPAAPSDHLRQLLTELIDGDQPAAPGSAVRSPTLVLPLALHGARLAALVGDDALLEQAWHQLGLAAPLLESDLFADQRQRIAAQRALRAGDPAQACQRWRDTLAREERTGLFGWSIETRLRLADALAGLPGAGPGHADDIARVLRPALARLHQDGEPGWALLAGAPTLERIARLAAAWPLTSDEQALLARCAAMAAALSVAPTPQGHAIHGGLSERECEVLACVAAGNSNKLIARRLALSPLTVKRHVSNILDKLDLQSRGQAAAWFLASKSGNADRSGSGR